MNKSLNTFRTFAFLSVFFFHAAGFGIGYLGVHAFFVLSGYLITPILLKTKKNTNSFKEFLINFYGRRMLRIFPPYYFYLIAVTLIIFIVGVQNVPDYREFINQLPWAATYTYDFYHTTASFYHLHTVSHFWSLAVEEQFYIFWPLVIYFLPELKLKRFFIAMMVLGPLVRFFTGIIVDHHWLSFLSSQKDVVIYVLPFSHIDAFVIGGFFSVFARNYKPGTMLLGSCFIAIIAFGFFTAKIFTHSLHFSTFGYAPFMIDSYKYIWGYTLFSFFFGLVLLRLNRRDLWPAIFENNTLNYLGKISYGMYIYHYAILYLVVTNLKTMHIYTRSIVMQRACSSVIALTLTIIVSILSYELLEKFFLLWKDKLFPKEHELHSPIV